MDNSKRYGAARFIMKTDKAVYNVEKVITVIFMYALVAILFINVLFRFVLFIPSAWAEELGRYVFVWLVYMGSATAMFKWEHIDINLVDSIIDRLTRNNTELGEKILAAIKKAAVVITIAYLIFLVWEYGKYLQQVKNIGLKSMFLSFGLEVPMSAIFFCGFLMIFHAVCYLFIPEKLWKEAEKE